MNGFEILFEDMTSKSGWLAIGMSSYFISILFGVVLYFCKADDKTVDEEIIS